MSLRRLTLPSVAFVCTAWFAGCQPPTADSGVPPVVVEDDGPAPYIFDPEQLVDADIELSFLEDELDAALEATANIDISPLLDAYGGLMDQSTNNCPEWHNGDDGEYWYDYCTTNQGATFSGYGVPLDAYKRWSKDYSEADDKVNGGDGIQAGAIIENENGEVFSIAGSAYEYWVYDSDIDVVETSILGSFAWEGLEGAGNWLGEGMDPTLTRVIIDSFNTGGREVSLNGGITGLQGEMTTISYDGVYIYDGSYPGSCDKEPYGAISLLTREGVWYDVVFDGPSAVGAVVDSSVCDGCGMAFYGGTSLGLVCADFSILFERD